MQTRDLTDGGFSRAERLVCKNPRRACSTPGEHSSAAVGSAAVGLPSSTLPRSGRVIDVERGGGFGDAACEPRGANRVALGPLRIAEPHRKTGVERALEWPHVVVVRASMFSTSGRLGALTELTAVLPLSPSFFAVPLLCPQCSRPMYSFEYVHTQQDVHRPTRDPGPRPPSNPIKASQSHRTQRIATQRSTLRLRSAQYTPAQYPAPIIDPSDLPVRVSLSPSPRTLFRSSTATSRAQSFVCLPQAAPPA